jgi:hypothetical protein
VGDADIAVSSDGREPYFGRGIRSATIVSSMKTREYIGSRFSGSTAVSDPMLSRRNTLQGALSRPSHRGAASFLARSRDGQKGASFRHFPAFIRRAPFLDQNCVILKSARKRMVSLRSKRQKYEFV